MNAATLQAWVEGHRRAWERNDSREVGALFTDDATYAMRPFGEPARGREAIDANIAVVRGWTSYADPPTDYSNIWVLQLTADGRCASFAEWWMERERP